jgi:hypothetical protein
LLAGNFDCVSALKPDTDKSVSEDLTAWSLRPPETRKAENPDKSRLSALLLASLPGFEPGASGLGEPPNQRNGLMPAAIPYAECKAVQWFSCFSLLPTFSQKSAVFFATGGWLFAPRWNTDTRLSFRLMLMYSYGAAS